jgi:hypothetical protein
METNAKTADPRTRSALHELALLANAELFRDSFAGARIPSPEPRASDAVLRMRLVGANPHARVSGLEELPGKSNYFIGNDAKKWRTNVPSYAKVKYSNVYPGVDLVYYGNQGKLEYDFVVQPGTDPRQIALDVGAGLAPPERPPQAVVLRVNAAGDLVVATDGGEVVFHKPIIYQPAAYNEPRTKNEELIDGRYILAGDRVTFEVASYDKTRPLVIDPVLAYSTYLGATTIGYSIAVDASGNAYVTGETLSTYFPVTPGAFQTGWGGGSADAFVSKFNAAGSALIYSTYLGENDFEYGAGIAVDASGNAYVSGDTSSSDFPTTPGAFQTTFGGGGGFGTCPGIWSGGCDPFVTKLNATGSALVYSTYLGGTGPDVGTGITVDTSGNAYVTGSTASSDFPTTPGAFQTVYGGNGNAFVSKLNATGSALVYSTYLGGSGGDSAASIAVGATGNAYVTGGTESSNFPTTAGAFQTTYGGTGDCYNGWSCGDAFVTQLNATGSALVYSTYLGGSSGDSGASIAVGAAGSAYVTGGTTSSNFPTTAGAFQTACCGAFVSKLNAHGSTLVYSTYLGGDSGYGIAVDASGNGYVTGYTQSSDFPTTPGAFQTIYGGAGNAFISELNAAGSALNYSTYFGGSAGVGASAIAIDASGNVYIIGSTYDSDLPTTPGAFQTTYATGGADAVVAKMSPADVPGVATAPGSLTFATQAVGTTSAPQTFALLDVGSQPLSITSVVASGDFAQTNSCGNSVPVATTCTITVTFTPTATATRTGAITITDDAAGSPHQLPLTGTGVSPGPVVTLTPMSLTFASQPVGTTSPTQQATLTNTGGAALNMSSIGGFGDFALSDNCPGTLAAGASCTLNVAFTPTAAPGNRRSSVVITDNAPASPQKLPLSGTATGTGSIILTLSPPSLTFGSVAVGSSSDPQTVTVTNNGTVAASLSPPLGLGIGGTNRQDFLLTSQCGTSLAPQASCTATVTFQPTRTGGRAALFVARQGAATLKLTLSGTGM